VYTGKDCEANQVATGKCIDISPKPFVGGYRITNALDATEVLASGTVSQGSEITFDASASGCIPDTIAVTISLPTGEVVQTFTVDSSCDGGRGLILIENYGAFESTGYSCSATDVHNCKQDVSYGLKVCNNGIEDERVYEFSLTEKDELSGDMTVVDIIARADPADLDLKPEECFYDTELAVVDRCTESSYCVEVAASATNPITGLPENCPGEDEIKFGWPGTPPPPDTSPPRYVHLLYSCSSKTVNLSSLTFFSSFSLAVPNLVQPLRRLLGMYIQFTPQQFIKNSKSSVTNIFFSISSRSPAPSPSPSSNPTSVCVIDIELTGCPKYNISLDNNCEGRPQVITFRYLGGVCSQSDNLQPRQKFSCEDANGGPPTAPGTPNYIIATPTGGNDLYFEGPVAVGEKYTLNPNKDFDKLSADMTIQVFSSQGGSLLQTTDLHLSCSQPLFLFDKFGASQVTEWIETSGRIVTDTQTDVPTGSIVVQLDAALDLKPVRLREMQIITSALDTPIDYTSQVAGVVLEPGVAIELPGFEIDIELGTRTRYTFFTTIIGETLDGTSTCNGNSFLECTVGFNLDPAFPTNVPTPRPTITPFPTGSPNVTACEIASNIGCTVTNPGGNIITCDRLRGDVSATCPADQDLLTAFLRYDGSLGASIFVVPTCGEAEYNTRTVLAGEIFEFSSRASDTCEEVEFEIYESGDGEGNGEFIDSSPAQIACPGPWTIGNVVAPGLTLEYYASTSDSGTTFNFNILEAELEIQYTGINTGNSPLTVNSGGISGPSPFDTGALTGLPATITQRNRQVLKTETKSVSLLGQAGQSLDFSMSLFGTAANSFALPCETASAFSINL
jgi:hypothetical protein